MEDKKSPIEAEIEICKQKRRIRNDQMDQKMAI